MSAFINFAGFRSEIQLSAMLQGCYIEALLLACFTRCALHYGSFVGTLVVDQHVLSAR